jgi:hypothetical protein
MVPFLRIFHSKKAQFFLLGMSTFFFFSFENNWIFTLTPKFISFSFGFVIFFADIEQKGSYFAFDHGEERIKQNTSFRYRNE